MSNNQTLLSPDSINEPWDNIEIHPLCEEDGVAFICDNEYDADYWGVYVHNASGGIQCIADCDTAEQAQRMAMLIGNAVKFYTDNKVMDY